MKKYEELQNLIERADQLIRLQATGNSREFADTLGISRASVYRLLEYMKTLGAPIKFNKYQKTYYYEYPVKIKITCVMVYLEG